MSLLNGLNIARNTLTAQSTVLDVIAHNIANANTPGYSRQQVTLLPISDDATTGVRMSPFLKLGSGVEVESVQRTRFALYDDIFRNENNDLSFNTRIEQLMSQVEVLFDEPSDRGLGGIVNDFFNSWQDVANHPQDNASRQSLASIAEEMTTRMHRLYDSLVTMREDIDTEQVQIPQEINSISRGIADLNVAIRKSESQGNIANDLRDKRDKLLDDLSAYVDVRTVEQKDGTVTVLVGSTVVVEKDSVITLETKSYVTDRRGLKRTSILTEAGNEFIPESGELGALISFRDDVIIDLMDQLDTLAESIVTTINFDHRNGYGLDGFGGRNFFNPDNTKAYNIELSADIDDVSHIAVSLNGLSGDNQNALKISELGNLRVINGSFTINEFYNGLVADLGIMSREAQTSRTNGELLVSQIENSRESVKGVNIDEELIHMIETQRIYQSAARIITVLDNLFEEVVNLV